MRHNDHLRVKERRLHRANPVLQQIVIAGTTVPDPSVVSALRAEFPSLAIRNGFDDKPGAFVRASQWRHPGFDIYAHDARIDALDEVGPFALGVIDDAPPSAAVEIATRCQRAIRRRNDASRVASFDTVLSAHRALHDRSKPLVRADYNHALDTWQWLLRLEPKAALAVQLAALFHDIERLESEAERRVEHEAPDYQLFKNRHAAAGAEQAAKVLQRCGIETSVCRRAAELIARHEQRETGDAELLLLNDADALSFFSLNSTGYADYFGPEHTRRKLAYTLARLGPEARRHLPSIHLRSDVRELFASCTE